MFFSTLIECNDFVAGTYEQGTASNFSSSDDEIDIQPNLEEFQNNFPDFPDFNEDTFNEIEMQNSYQDVRPLPQKLAAEKNKESISIPQSNLGNADAFLNVCLCSIIKLSQYFFDDRTFEMEISS